MKKQAGFTLIELVVVIVILGILAATAAPKFIDLTSDARISVMSALQGSIKSGSDLAHARALIDGETDETGSITVAGETVTLANGWPNLASIELVIDYDGDISTTTAGTFFHTGASDSDNCTVTYVEAASANEAPVVTLEDSGC